MWYKVGKNTHLGKIEPNWRSQTHGYVFHALEKHMQKLLVEDN